LRPDALDDPLLAVRIAEEAIAANGNKQKCERALGAALFRAGQIDKAIEHLDRACRLDSEGSDLAAQLFLGMAYFKAGQIENARAQLDKVRPLVADRSFEPGAQDDANAPCGSPPKPSSALSEAARRQHYVFLPLVLQDRVALKPLFLEATSLIGE
jgi:tetratricopeptide (TPR) repeat protein